MSLEECTVPRSWAEGYINILPKGGNLKDTSNWRPITQTALPGKLLENIVQSRFLNELMNMIISIYNNGFSPW